MVAGNGPAGRRETVSGPTRRALLGGAGATLLAGCGSSAKSPSEPAVRRRPAAGTARDDVRILRQALELERRTVAAYTAGIPLLEAGQAQWAKRFLSEELQHTGELISLLRLAGATAPPPADSYAIGHPRDGAGVIDVLDGLEELQISSYLTWIPRLSPGTMRAAVASILASDAQHITALRQAQGRPAMSSAFVGDRA